MKHAVVAVPSEDSYVVAYRHGEFVCGGRDGHRAAYPPDDLWLFSLVPSRAEPAGFWLVATIGVFATSNYDRWYDYRAVAGIDTGIPSTYI